MAEEEVKTNGEKEKWSRKKPLHEFYVALRFCKDSVVKKIIRTGNYLDSQNSSDCPALQCLTDSPSYFTENVLDGQLEIWLWCEVVGRVTLPMLQLAEAPTLSLLQPCLRLETILELCLTLLLACSVGHHGSWALGMSFLSPSGVALFIHWL